MYFFNGGLTYSDIENMTIPQLFEMQKHAERIQQAQKNATK